jgi:predicted DNA-binding transcriptional regulator AlpA
MKNLNSDGALLVSSTQAAKLLGISRTSFFRLLSRGTIQPNKKMGLAKHLFAKKEIERLAAK